MPSGSGSGYGIGPANYARLPITYADPVLQAPGVVQVTLPPYQQLLLWNFDPEEEGTGDYPPRVDDATVTARLVTWIRVRYPPLPDSAAATTTTTTDHLDLEREPGHHSGRLRRRVRLSRRGQHGANLRRAGRRRCQRSAGRPPHLGRAECRQRGPGGAGQPGDRRDGHGYAVPDLLGRQHPGGDGRHRFPARGAGSRRLDDLAAD